MVASWILFISFLAIGYYLLKTNNTILTEIGLVQTANSTQVNSSIDNTAPQTQANEQPWKLVQETHIIAYNDSDMDFSNHLKFTLQALLYDINGDGIIDNSDVSVYIANKLLPTSKYIVKPGYSAFNPNAVTVLIPFTNYSDYPKGAIIRIQYGVPK